MNARCGSATTRAVVTALLLLVVSPVTAPFLTFDARVLFSDEAPQSLAIVQSKKAHDEPVSACPARPALQLTATAVGEPIIPVSKHVLARQPTHVPLRI